LSIHLLKNQTFGCKNGQYSEHVRLHAKW